MCKENQINKPETKPALNTKPAGSGVIYESFAQYDFSKNQRKERNSSEEN